MAWRVLEVSESGYDACKRRKESHHPQEDRSLAQQIQRIFQEGRGVYGSPRVHAVLQQRGLPCSRKRVVRLMRQGGFVAMRKRHQARTTESNHAHPVAPNLLQRDFHAQHPNKKWVADMTGIWTYQGWLYLAGVVACYSRLLVGWAMSAPRDETLVEDAVIRSLGRRQPAEGLLHHTDRGSPYTSGAYQDLLAERGITLSMSRKGKCWDNALMESVWATVKGACVERHVFTTHQAARPILFEYLEVCYNRQRIHSSLGYQSPAHFEHVPQSSDSSKTP